MFTHRAADDSDHQMTWIMMTTLVVVMVMSSIMVTKRLLWLAQEDCDDPDGHNE